MRHELVTGSEGFVESHFLDEPLSTGYDVIVLDNLALAVHNGYLRTSTSRQRTVEGDVRNQEPLWDLLSQVDSVRHQASTISIGRSMHEMEEFVDIKARTAAILVDVLAWIETSVEAVVVASFIFVYGEVQYQCEDCGLRPSPTQREGPPGQDGEWEPKCQDCDARLEPVPTIETVTPDLRSVYGSRHPLDNPYTGVCAIFLNRIGNEKPILVFKDGAQTRDFIHVLGVARGKHAALKQRDINRVVVNVGTSKPANIPESAETLIHPCDADFSIDGTNRYRRGNIRHCTADLIRASWLLSFDPTVSFEMGIRELVEWGRERDPDECFDCAITEIERNDELWGDIECSEKRPIVSGIARPTESLGDRTAPLRGA